MVNIKIFIDGNIEISGNGIKYSYSDEYKAFFDSMKNNLEKFQDVPTISLKMTSIDMEFSDFFFKNINNLTSYNLFITGKDYVYSYQERDYAPDILANVETGMIEIIGNAYEYDSQQYIYSLYYWFEKYFESPKPETHLNFKIGYCNTMWIRRFMEINNRFIQYSNNHTIQINWFYYDEDTKEYGLKIQEQIQYKFNFIKSTEPS